MNKKDIKDKIKNGVLYSVFGIASLNPQFSNANENSNRDDTKNRIEQIKASAQNKQEANTADFKQYLRDITYYNSAEVSEYATQGAAYSPLYNSIYNTQEKDETILERTLQLIHEAHHKDDYMQEIMSRDMSPQEYFKLNSHLESSANITTCLAIRDGFKKAKDKKAFLDNLEKQSPTACNFKFYIDKLRDQTITPDKTISKQEFDAEMAFIANGTRDMWLNKFMKDYEDNFSKNAQNRSRIKGTTGKSNPDNFNRGISITYKIGGIDFSKYMNTTDIPIPPKQQEKLAQIEHNPATQDMSFEDIYGNGKEKTLVSSRYETTPQKMSILDLSPNSKLLSSEYDRLNNEQIKTKQLDNLVALNDSLKQKLETEKYHDYTLGSLEKMTQDLENKGFWHSSEKMSESLCNKYGNNAQQLVNLVSEFPNIMLNENDQNAANSLKTLNDREAIQKLADAPAFSKQQTDFLLNGFKETYTALGKAYSVLDDNGKYIQDTSNPYASHFKLRHLKDYSFAASNYIKTPQDLDYLQSAIKNPDAHPELWPNDNGANINHSTEQLFNKGMNRQQFEELLKKHEDIKAIQNILNAKAEQENAQLSSEDRITTKDLSYVAKHLYDKFGTENAQKIAQNMVDTPKKFGGKSLAKLIHIQPAQSNNYLDIKDYNEKKGKQNSELRENIEKFAQKNNISQKTSETNNQVSALALKQHTR